MAIGKTKDYKSEEFKRVLIANGFELDRSHGGHLIYKRNNDTIVITKNKINKMICRRMIKTYGLKFKK